MQKLMKVVLVCALLIITVVIPLGAFTRLSDSGLGCPDWPGCYGFIDFRKSMEHVDEINTQEPGALRESHKTWPEMVHRYFASKLGLLILLIAIGVSWSIWKGGESAKLWSRRWGWLPVILLVLVCFQGALGMWTVTMKLYPPTVVAHLYGGFLTFSLLVLLAIRAFALDPPKDMHLEKLKTLALVCLLFLVVQIGLGGWMSANYAALVCTELPVCENGWMSKLDFEQAFSAPYDASTDYEFGLLNHDSRVTIHVMHRLFALIVSLLMLILIVSGLRSKAQATSKKVLVLLLALLVVQVGLGLSNVVFHLPLGVATAHNGVGALLMAALIYFNYLCFRKSEKPTYE